MAGKLARLAWIALWPVALAAQDPRLGRVDPSVRDSVAALTDSARVEGLPANALIEKALEGTSKQARGPVILAAVRALAAELRSARSALGSSSTTAEVAAGAAALHSGARPTDLADLRLRRPAQSLLVPLGVLSDLVARGVPPDSASHAVLALASRAADEDYLAFRREVERDIALGAPPAAAAAVRLNASARQALTAHGQKP